jgi:putative YhbY family RNA-binding protein
LALQLSPAERSALRARAHALEPVVIVGDAGLSPAVTQEIERSLLAHGLIKIRASDDDRDAREEILQRICDALGASPVQHIGKILVVYRPKPEDTPKRKTGARRKPARALKRTFQNRA